MSVVISDDEAWTFLPPPRPLVAWVAAQKHTGVPTTIRDLEVIEYPVVALRLAPWGGGGWVVQSDRDMIEPLAELSELTSNEGVLLAVLPPDERPELNRELPRALNTLQWLGRERPGTAA